MQNLVVIVSGSRGYSDREAIRARLMLYDPRSVVIHHGDCPTGADAIADEIACELGFGVQRFPADWKRLGRAAGPIRNGIMLKEARARVGDECVRGELFSSNVENSPGTRNMRDRLVNAGIAFHVSS